MARDGSGTYSLPATMATANATASSTTVNSIMNDVATALTESINKDGSKAFAGNQSMGGNKLTNLAAGTALADAPQLSQVQKGNVSQATTVGGTVDAITLAFTPAITSYTTGMRIRWVSGGANTIVGATINVDSIGTKTLKKNPAAAALAVGDLGASGTIHEAVYDGTYFVVLNPVVASTAASDTASGVVELATTTEVLTGTDTARAVTPDALAALWEQGSDVASATTTSLAEGGYFNITGTTTISDIDFGTDKAGRKAWVKFAGALTLTHSSNLILPGAANITTAAGDTACFVSEGTDVVRCVSYNKADGTSVAGGSITFLGTITTTSGTSNTLGSLTLTNYSFLMLVFNGVSHAGGTRSILLGNSTSDDVSVTNTIITAADAVYGTCMVDLNTGIASFFGGCASGALAGGNDTALSTSTTTISVAMSGGDTFDAGSIRVYGMR